MDLKTRGLNFISSLIGLTRQGEQDAPRNENACAWSENVQVEAEKTAQVSIAIASAPVHTCSKSFQKKSENMVVGRQKYAGLPDLVSLSL